MTSARYIRQTILPEIGIEGQGKLHKSSVIIVGCGGLGIPAALYLAGAGVGCIHLIDCDNVELSNLHRQIVYKEEDIGTNKAIVLANHLKAINSEITIIAHEAALHESNAPDLFSAVDCILDCSDNLITRYLINDTCVKLDKTFVSASIYKYEGQVGTFNFKNGATYRCLYNTNEKKDVIASCEEAGVLGTLPAQLGVLQANELIKIVLNLEGVLTNKLLIYNILTYETSFFKLSRNEALCKEIKSKSLNAARNPFEMEISENELPDFLTNNKVVFVDVREEFEAPQIPLNNMIKMPISAGISGIDELNLDDTFLCFCQVGIRSLTVASILREKGFKAYSLAGGVKSITKHFPVIKTDQVNL